MSEKELKDMEVDEVSEKALFLAVGDGYGIYIPQMFAQLFPHGDQVAEEEWKVLLAGPEADDYWEVWDSVLEGYRHPDGRTLYQDGNLWLVDNAPIDEWEEATGRNFWEEIQ